MRTLLTINVSDNDEEIFVYDGDGSLIMIRPVGDPETVGNYVASVIDNQNDE
jgi:hypothetical protein